ncbi:Protein CBG07479 [Caenorhabditis briggsae]|uniref:Protein CBG07479 n=1 Tax=Caenorhabditis briggsae TaxID=6238 RepID=A8X4P4_CAEBR|nr:Protein CBG07479 [Caenorhabditis briggsae]CAP27604.1 Protein CBG07479 [Caenorhabditis briggsae]
MARPIVHDSSSSSLSSTRMQSAPINIAYANRYDHASYVEQWHWNLRRQEDISDDEDDIEQNQQTDDDEDDVFMMLQDGFSGYMIEDAPSTSSRMVQPADIAKPEDDVTTAAAPAVAEQKTQEMTSEITPEKIAQMSEDVFEQLLAENELQLRQLIRRVSNRHLVLN